jgi:hypothetical protein
MEGKFNKGDLVGWKSDTDFTKSNRDLPAMKVIESNETDIGYEYAVTGNVGWVSEYELEKR